MGKEQPFIPVDVRTALTSGGVSTVDEFVHQAQLLGLGALGGLSWMQRVEMLISNQYSEWKLM